jgi:type II secretory pathway pseudopilin PulG
MSGRGTAQRLFSFGTLFSLAAATVILAISARAYFVHAIQERAYLAEAMLQMGQIARAAESYRSERGSYPPDGERGLPPELMGYLGTGTWPQGPWKGSTYDWDYWIDAATGEAIVQVSVRFCPTSDSKPNECSFPKQPWVDSETWDGRSAAYHCISGACRAHHFVNSAGHCLNCEL